MKISLALSTVLLFSMTSFASAQEADNTWQREDLKIQFTGNAVKKNARAKSYAAETLFSDHATEAGDVAITCINNMLSVAVAVKPLDMREFVTEYKTSRGARTNKVAMTINGDTQKFNDWTYLPKLKILLARKKSDRAKVYNGAIRGDTITLKMDFKDEVTLNLPKPNKDFAKFGAPCGIGNQKNAYKEKKADAGAEEPNMSEDK